MSESDQVVIGPYRAGEIPPPIVVTYKDSAGNPIDLTSYQGRWVYRQHSVGAGVPFGSSDPASVTRNATVHPNQSTNKGQVTYTWASADLATQGYYEAEMWVGNGTNRFASVRYVYTVRDAIAIPSI